MQESTIQSPTWKGRSVLISIQKQSIYLHTSDFLVSTLIYVKRKHKVFLYTHMYIKESPSLCLHTAATALLFQGATVYPFKGSWTDSDVSYTSEFTTSCIFTKSTKCPQSPESASPSSACSYKKKSTLKGKKHASLSKTTAHEKGAPIHEKRSFYIWNREWGRTDQMQHVLFIPLYIIAEYTRHWGFQYLLSYCLEVWQGPENMPKNPEVSFIKCSFPRADTEIQKNLTVEASRKIQLNNTLHLRPNSSL